MSKGYLSYSAWKKYHMCPRLYKLHYIDRLRKPGTSSPLIFGSAVDGAMNELYTKDKVDPVAVFRDNFKWEDCKEVEWDGKDFDPDLFTTEGLAKVEGKSWEYKCWASMRIKGRLLIDKHMEEIHPLITKVYSVQYSLKDRPGFLDLICEIKGIKGKVVLDFKTSARPYFKEQLTESTQLALYAHHVGVDNVGFAVFVKQIGKDRNKICQKCGFDGSGRSHKTCFKEVKGKRCNGVWDETVRLVPKLQLFVDKVDSVLGANVEKSIVETEKLIETGHFPCNYESCNWQFGRKCVYKKLCFEGSKEGLVHKPEEKK